MIWFISSDNVNMSAVQSQTLVTPFRQRDQLLLFVCSGGRRPQGNRLSTAAFHARVRGSISIV